MIEEGILALFYFQKEKDQNEANQAERIRKYGHDLRI